jgi:peptidylprolyl isomerase
MSPSRKWLPGLGVAALAFVLLAGCGSSTSSTTTTTSAGSISSGSKSATSTATTFPPVIDPSPAGTFGTKPTVVVPPGSPPTQLESSDLIVGTGPEAKAGDTVTVQYVGVAYSNRQQFDASWDRGQPFTFPLGEGQVIPGWDKGVVGMKVGGRRELIIPPNLAYGAQPPQGSTIAPNDTLVFVIDLIKIN